MQENPTPYTFNFLTFCVIFISQNVSPVTGYGGAADFEIVRKPAWQTKKQDDARPNVKTDSLSAAAL